MSFCPTKDIHSIYLDNEMSAEIKAQYEKHLSCCPECQKQLEQMRQVRSVFEKDNLDSSVEKEFLDASFERLQLKMKFSDNVKKTKKSNFVFTNSRWMYAVSGVAAAALFALIIPIRVKVSNVNGLNAIDVTRNPTIVPTAISNNGMTLLGKIDKENKGLVIIEGVKSEGLGLAIMNRLIRACSHNYINIR